MRVLGPLEVQTAILTTEPFLQPFSIGQMGEGGTGHVAHALECSAHEWPSRESSPPPSKGTQVSRSCALSDMAAQIRTLVLWKRTLGVLALSVRGTDCFQNCWNQNGKLERRGDNWGFSACNCFPWGSQPSLSGLGFRVQS